MILRLRCPCGRNLADVTRPTRHGTATNPVWTRDGLAVSRRPNVDQTDYRPWDAANRAGPIGSPERAAATPNRTENTDWDWHDRTYRWRCKCGETHERRHDRISGAWTEHMIGNRRLVILIVGRDV